MEPVLEAQELHKSYHDGDVTLHILQGTSLRVVPGEVVSVIGRSGTGKSTLLHCLGLLDTPDQGEIRIRGYDTRAMRESRRTRLRGRAIGYVFQQHHLLGDFTALENVMLAGHFGITNQGRRKAVSLLEAVGLADRMRHKPRQLSGGEQQRVAIARALMNDPAILLCDEPTGNLDPVTGQGVMETVWTLVRTHQTAMVLVTHDREIAARGDRVLHLQEGRLHEEARV